MSVTTDIRTNPRDQSETQRSIRQIVNALDMSSGVDGVASGYKLARGQHTTTSASDTVVTGLTTVVAAVANLETAPSLNTDRVQAVVGDQAGSPAAGSIYIKTYRPTSSADTTPVAAQAAFGYKVNWIAIGV